LGLDAHIDHLLEITLVTHAGNFSPTFVMLIENTCTSPKLRLVDPVVEMLSKMVSGRLGRGSKVKSCTTISLVRGDLMCREEERRAVVVESRSNTLKIMD